MSTGLRHWPLLRWAIRIALVTSAINAIPYGLHGWRSPSHPQVTFGMMVLIQFIGAAIIGAGADIAKPFVTSRWRAGLVGAPLLLAVMQLGYWSLLYVRMTSRQFTGFCVIGLLEGFIAGVVLWERPFGQSRYR